MRTQIHGPGVHIPLHRIEPLAQLPVRQPLAVGAGLGEPGVPERVPRPVAGHARKPAVLQAQRGLPVRRAGHRPRRHRVRAAQHGAAGGGNPRRQQGRGPRDRRTPADTAHAVVGEDLNTKAGTASAKGTGTEPGRNLKRKAGRHRSLPARGGRGPERKPAPQGRGAGHGKPGAYFTNMQPVRPRPQDPPTVADTICVWPAGSRPMPTTVGGDLDFGAGGAFRVGSVPGRGKGAAARPGGDPVGAPRDP